MCFFYDVKISYARKIKEKTNKQRTNENIFFFSFTSLVYSSNLCKALSGTTILNRYGFLLPTSKF